MSGQLEAVHTVHDWYDGPRSGAASYQGVPYWYRSLYLDTEAWNPDEDRFELTVLTPEALAWELERDSIFHRWDAARKAGAVVWKDGDEKTFGAFPEEMDRYHRLNQSMETFLSRTKATIMARGSFELGCKEVRWSLLDETRGPESSASPNGGPASPFGNSGATGGPP